MPQSLHLSRNAAIFGVNYLPIVSTTRKRAFPLIIC